MGASVFQVNCAHQRSLLLKNHETQLIMFPVPEPASHPQAHREWVAKKKSDVRRCIGGLSAGKTLLEKEKQSISVGDFE